jgi:hypothetical protein
MGEKESEYYDIIYRTSVKRLCGGHILKLLFGLLKEIKIFTERNKNELKE